MKGKINGHVDKYVHLLMKIAKTKLLKDIKLEKGKTSYRIGNRNLQSIKL